VLIIWPLASHVVKLKTGTGAPQRHTERRKLKNGQRCTWRALGKFGMEFNVTLMKPEPMHKRPRRSRSASVRYAESPGLHWAHHHRSHFTFTRQKDSKLTTRLFIISGTIPQWYNIRTQNAIRMGVGVYYSRWVLLVRRILIK
jgi:hypothetical protein